MPVCCVMAYEVCMCGGNEVCGGVKDVCVMHSVCDMQQLLCI
jgi:hypothetical protein